MEEEVVCLKKNLEKVQIKLNMNIQQIKGSKKLEVILNAQRSPLIKTRLGYEGESNKSKVEDKRTITFVKATTGEDDNSHQFENKNLSNTSTSSEQLQTNSVGKVLEAKEMDNQTTIY